MQNYDLKSMKPMKISYFIIIITPSLTINYVMPCVYQLGEPVSIQASNQTLYNISQSYLENNNSSTLIFSITFYLSNATRMLGKIPIEKSSTINREVQFFVERRVINTSMVTYSVGYYVEDSNMNGSTSDSKSLSNDLKSDSGPNYAKGYGIFLTENGGSIEWDAFDQIMDKSDDKGLFAGIMFFSPATTTADKNDELSFLKNRGGLYEFSIDVADDIPTLPLLLHLLPLLPLLPLLLIPPIERYDSGPLPTNHFQGLNEEKLDSKY